MDKKNVISVGVAVVLAVAISGFVFGIGQDGQNGVNGRNGRDGSVGAAAGPALYENIQFLNGYTKAGRRVATTTTAADNAVTLTTKELDTDVAYISYNPGVNTTLTTMASTSAPLSGLKVGESFSVLLYNATTSAATTITLAAGTGVDLQEDEGATVVVNGLEVARLTFVKKENTDVIAWLEVGQVGD